MGRKEHKGKECRVCRWREECVNVGEFLIGDCLTYEKQRRKVA